jgi:hypothetical protein
MTHRWLGLAAIAVSVAVSMAAAQSAPAFDVASIKPNKSGDSRRGIGPEPGVGAG